MICRWYLWGNICLINMLGVTENSDHLIKHHGEYIHLQIISNENIPLKYTVFKETCWFENKLFDQFKESQNSPWFLHWAATFLYSAWLCCVKCFLSTINTIESTTCKYSEANLLVNISVKLEFIFQFEYSVLHWNNQRVPHQNIRPSPS